MCAVELEYSITFVIFEEKNIWVNRVTDNVTKTVD